MLFRSVLSHVHTSQALARKVAEAESIALDLRKADADYAQRGVESSLFEPAISGGCMWCDFRAHCPAGQLAGPEKSDWAGLESEGSSGGEPRD